MNTSPVVVSTFAGCGGSSLGYKRAGCKVLLAIDFEQKAIDTYKMNFPGTKVWKKNIREITGKMILDEIGLKVGELDIFDGSPPCTPFSALGKRDKGWGKSYKHSSEKTAQVTDDLFFEYIRLVKELNPKIFIAENVRGMITGKAKGYFNIILKEMKKLGYNIKVLDLNAKDFEVPQSRPRVIFIGIRNDVFLGWNMLSPHKTIPLREAWKGIVNSKKDLKEAQVSKTQKYNHLWKYVPQGGSLKKFHPKGSYFSYRKLNLNKPSSTIVAGALGEIRHPTEERSLTHTELKRIGSFPDDFKFLSYNDMWTRIGNSVPPNLIKNIILYAMTAVKPEFVLA